MSILEQAKKTRGQALIELTVILPVLVLFMVAVLPLIAWGISLPWLDERLTLRQLSQDDEEVHELLLLTHKLNLIPPYFDKTGLEETTRRTPLGMTIPMLPDTFPGDMTRKLITTTLPEFGWWNRKHLGNPQKRDSQISGSLTMVRRKDLLESQVSNEVKKLTVIGLASGRISILEKTGFNFFHLNLDALPETVERGERK